MQTTDTIQVCKKTAAASYGGHASLIHGLTLAMSLERKPKPETKNGCEGESS